MQLEKSLPSKADRRGGVNSPTFAYKAIYGKEPDNWISGRTDHPQKQWNGIPVDEHMDVKVLDALEAIEEIEGRASCEGHNSERVAYFVFRLKEQIDEEANARGVADKLNSNDGYYSIADIGNEGRPRIVVAGKIWYGKGGWKEWWEGLADKIKEAVKEASCMGELGIRPEETLIKNIAIYDPSKVDDFVLADDWRIVNGWYAMLKAGQDIKFSDREIFETGKKIVKETIARDKVTFRPQEMKATSLDLLRRALADLIERGLYLVPPHGEMIYKSDKTAMVKSQKFKVPSFFILTSDARAYGFIRFKEPKRINLREFAKLRDKHRISDDERRAWWKNKGWLYYYEIREFVPFEKPRAFKKPAGVQTFIKSVTLQVKIDPRKIDPEFLEGLSDDELIILHGHLHGLYWKVKKAGGAVENVVSAHKFLVNEMKARMLEHRYADKLDEIFFKESNYIYLDDVLEHFRDFALSKPDVSIVGSLAVSGRGRDIDLLMQGVPSQAKEFRIRKMLPNHLVDRVQFIYKDQISPGAFTNYLPLYSLEERRIPDAKIVAMQKELKIELGKPFTPLKAAAGYRIGEFFNYDDFWTFWGKEYIEKKFAVERKYDGIRLVCQKQGDKVQIFTEDKKRDRAFILPDVVEEIRRLPVKNAIIDGEMVWWKEGAPLPRREMVAIVVGKEPLHEDFHFNIFDCLWIGDKAINELPWRDRQKALEKILPKDLKYLKRVKPKIVGTEKECRKAVDEVSEAIGSEGAMFKAIDSPYIEERTGDWAKLKLVKEVKMMIIGRKKVPKGKPPKKKVTKEWMEENLPRLLKESKMWTYRVAFLGKKKGKLVAMDSETKLTPAEIKFTWDEERQKWKGLEDPKMWEMGKGFEDRKVGEYAYGHTYNSAIEPTPKIGDIITCAPILIRKWEDDQGKTRYSWMFPIVRNLDPTRKKPDDITVVEKIIKESEKIRKKKLEEFEREREFLEDAESQEADEIMEWLLQYPPDRIAGELQALGKELPKNPEADKLIKKWTAPNFTRDELKDFDPKKLPKGFFVYVHHYRGKSAHGDFRTKVNGNLEGFTIASQVKGAIKKGVDAFKEAKKYDLDHDGKLWKFRPDMPPTVHCWATGKAKQPLVWATIVKHIHEPGSVGATRFDEGVFWGEDWGLLWQGTQKPYFKEFFLRGGKFYGRLVLRMLTARKGWEKITGEELHWEAWMTKEELPYLLTRRGREKADYVPPEGLSGLSPEFEAVIPQEMKWWEKKKLSKKAALKLMDEAFNWLIDEGYLKGKKLPEKLEADEDQIFLAEAKFVLTRHWYMGAKVIREMPVSKWYIRFDEGKDFLESWELKESPAFIEEQAVLRKKVRHAPPKGESFRDWMTFEGILPPKHRDNPTKTLDVNVEIQDQGNANILEKNPEFMSVEFEGEVLKGLHTFKREAPDSPIWVFAKEVSPESEKKVLQEAVLV